MDVTPPGRQALDPIAMSLAAHAAMPKLTQWPPATIVPHVSRSR
jgi:hypothetical protein